MTKYRNTVHDFSRRTMSNLKIIEEIASRDKNAAFEITQLVNSAIGLLMFPREEIFEEIPETDIQTLRAQGWPLPKILYGEATTPNLRKLVKYTRNGFAHFNVDFVARNNQVTGLYLWNKRPRTDVVNWIAYISVEELRGLFENFAKEFQQITKDRLDSSKIDKILGDLGLARID